MDTRSGRPSEKKNDRHASTQLRLTCTHGAHDTHETKTKTKRNQFLYYKGGQARSNPLRFRLIGQSEHPVGQPKTGPKPTKCPQTKIHGPRTSEPRHQLSRNRSPLECTILKCLDCCRLTSTVSTDDSNTADLRNCETNIHNRGFVFRRVLKGHIVHAENNLAATFHAFH